MTPEPAAPIFITSDYMKTKRAQAIPTAYFENGAWYLPPPPVDPSAARVGTILFAKTLGQHPTIAAAAARSVLDIRPIDLSTERWNRLYPNGRPMSEDPWQRVLKAMESR